MDRFDWTMDVVMVDGRHRDLLDRYHCIKRPRLLNIHVNVQRSRYTSDASVFLTLAHETTGRCGCHNNGLPLCNLPILRLCPARIHPWSIVWHTPIVNNSDGAFHWLECTRFNLTVCSNLMSKFNSGIVRFIEVVEVLDFNLRGQGMSILRPVICGHYW